MKTRANNRATMVATILATLGFSAMTMPVQADIEAVSVMALQTQLIKNNLEFDITKDAGFLATEFTKQILNDLDDRLPTEMNQIIASTS